MDFIFCIPLVWGCPTKVHPVGDQTPRVCPRCHNASVTSAKSRRWFEFCFVPLIPMRSERIWTCCICQWSVPIQPGWEPALPGPIPQPVPQNPWQQPPAAYNGASNGYIQSGYQPGYIDQSQGPKNDAH
ncbi:uncharacterized protein LAESUDRAFT_671372 [Laetiporus sulphureus 93-53]|uniref:Zinc-ribbon 15 domain-containing protein n=1 Tax=Laetiporus sulphureus 93-53 TaxID=1314785 RepID=A0A165H949_9APHY|nr:uncharacterized protein LAESUDRAFT_671372 [Laetiporus sulphureus 93-53]KZT11414.1 hypothetical protein LAESUDRAFT_671372 [Laetiporus sulphureus 93-53]